MLPYKGVLLDSGAPVGENGPVVMFLRFDLANAPTTAPESNLTFSEGEELNVVSGRFYHNIGSAIDPPGIPRPLLEAFSLYLSIYVCIDGPACTRAEPALLNQRLLYPRFALVEEVVVQLEAARAGDAELNTVLVALDEKISDSQDHAQSTLAGINGAFIYAGSRFGTYCGRTTVPTTGNLVCDEVLPVCEKLVCGEVPGCEPISAHICNAHEIALDLQNGEFIPDGWFVGETWSCRGWSSNRADEFAGAVYVAGGTRRMGTESCNAALPLLCCDRDGL